MINVNTAFDNAAKTDMYEKQAKLVADFKLGEFSLDPNAKFSSASALEELFKIAKTLEPSHAIQSYTDIFNLASGSKNDCVKHVAITAFNLLLETGKKSQVYLEPIEPYSKAFYLAESATDAKTRSCSVSVLQALLDLGKNAEHHKAEEIFTEAFHLSEVAKDEPTGAYGKFALDGLMKVAKEYAPVDARRVYNNIIVLAESAKHNDSKTFRSLAHVAINNLHTRTSINFNPSSA
jgi:hypothetical protein